MDAEQGEKIIEGVVDNEAVFAAEDAQPRAVRSATLTNNSALDTYAVAAHVIKIAPAWLLIISVSFFLFILLLSWMRPDANASGGISYNPNDSKAPAVSPAVVSAPVLPSEKQQANEATPSAVGVGDNATSSVAPSRAESASSPSAFPAVQGNQANGADNTELKFTVQVGSYNDESAANEQVSRLRAAGFDAHTVAVELPGRGKWYRVQAGSFDERAGASKEAALLRAKGIASAAIVVPRQ